jgi:hypothetical protein
MASLSWPSLVESPPRSTFRWMLPTRCRHAIESSRHGMLHRKEIPVWTDDNITNDAQARQ